MQLDELLAGARRGRGGALVLHGEAGIGKTTLLEYAIESATDMRVLRTTGIESEMELAFAALHQLCAPVLERLERLPDPQAHALRTTFGLRGGASPDRLLVGLATLGLLAEAAEERPLLCVVDDVRWLDRASAQMLGFVARRIFAESIVMLLASRVPSEELKGLPVLTVEGLRAAAARELLASVIPWAIDDRVRERIVAETRGNPLALLELPRGLTRPQLAAAFRLVGDTSLEGRIEDGFVGRLRSLPADSQRLLLIAAADPTGDPALVLRAAERVGITPAAFTPVESAGLLEVGARVLFRHPLARSAVYRAASSTQRMEAHRVLAEATNPDVDPDMRAWHLADATSTANEDVAGELERAAIRAKTRGGPAAAAFLARAVPLTPDPARRAGRALTAAQTTYEAGLLDDARGLLAIADASACDDLTRARVQLLRAQIAFSSRGGNDALPLLLDTARRLESLDARLARETYLEAVRAATYVGRLARGAGMADVSRAALAAPRPRGDPRPPDLLLDGLANWVTAEYEVGGPLLTRALAAFRRESGLLPSEFRWLSLAGHAASEFWDDESWALLSGRQLERARDTGALTAIPYIIPNRAVLVALSGELTEASSLAEELRAAADAIGVTVPAGVALRLAALRGREDELSELIETEVRESVARGQGMALTVAETTRAMLYNGLGRHEAALSAIRPLFERTDEIGATRALPELIEAAARAGELDLAGRALERLTKTTAASGTNWALGVEARSCALLSHGEEAERLYREAIECLERTRVRVEHARAHLLYGEWLRREGRPVDARQQLRTAYGMLSAMGIEAFAARAERELRATGERVRKRDVERRNDLTAQEAQIARLAREGLSNPEIGMRLFISPRTVEYHLHKVFTKLGISSRNELRRALPQEPLAGVAV